MYPKGIAICLDEVPALGMLLQAQLDDEILNIWGFDRIGFEGETGLDWRSECFIAGGHGAQNGLYPLLKVT